MHAAVVGGGMLAWMTICVLHTGFMFLMTLQCLVASSCLLLCLTFTSSTLAIKVRLQERRILMQREWEGLLEAAREWEELEAAREWEDFAGAHRQLEGPIQDYVVRRRVANCA